MAKPKKRKSLLQSQREKLARQRAARRAAQRANRQISESNRRSLPSKGRTTATSPRARVQRGLTRDRLAKQQLQNFGRALQRSLKQRQAQNKLDQAAKGTKGGQTRTAGGAGQLVRRRGGSSSPTSQRIQPVRVRVEGQKQLPGTKAPAGKLPPAKPKLKPATGVNQAVSRAQLSNTLGKAKGRGGLLGTALMAAGGAAASSGLLGKKVQESFNEFNSRADKVLEPGFFNFGGKKPEKKPEKNPTRRGKPIRNRRGRIVGYEPVQPARRGMSNIPPQEGTGQGSPNDKPKTTRPTSGNGGGSGGGRRDAAAASTPKSRAYALDARNKEYDRLRKAGKTKEAEALGRKIAADARKKAPKNPFRAPQGAERKDRFSRDVAELKAMGKQKKKVKKKPQSAANKKGWQGNRNY